MNKPAKSKAKKSVTKERSALPLSAKAHVKAVSQSAATLMWVNRDRVLVKPVHELLKSKERFTLDDIRGAIAASKSKRTASSVASVWKRYELIREAR